MFKGLKLDKIGFDGHQSHYYKIGLKLYQSYQSKIENSLNSFFLKDKSLDGTKIIDSWFPKINAHIFISHSHKDEPLVIALSGWLYDKFELVSFVDSCIWGYGNDLINILDNEYSWLDKANRLYSYDKVLDSSSHVHMMLSTALFSMIDQTECLIFFDTPNSIKPFGNSDKTESPWIYSEIAFSQIVRKTKPNRIKYLKEEKYYSFDGTEQIEKALKIKYEIDSKHLAEIDHNILNSWAKYSAKSKKEVALDKLYEIVFPIKQIL